MDCKQGSWPRDEPPSKPLELEREEADENGVRGAPNALKLTESPDSGGNPRKETLLELAVGGGVVVAPAMSTTAAPVNAGNREFEVDVGNMELKEPAGALALQGLAQKLPGVAEKVWFG